MLACIVSMCTVGSFAAWKAGNVVLGGFTLFLTFCIGIRFLLKPSTERKETVNKGEKLDFKGVLISLFFGLTIGFGTGFVGTGGGMMMLVVFTAFLGMSLKPAVVSVFCNGDNYSGLLCLYRTYHKEWERYGNGSFGKYSGAAYSGDVAWNVG